MNKDLREFILKEIGRNSTYHSDKENFAWLATAFYIGSIVGFGYLAHHVISQLNDSTLCSPIPFILIKFVFVKLIFVFLASIILFLVFQYSNRCIAAKRVQELIEVYLSDSQIAKSDSQIAKIEETYKRDCWGTKVWINITAVALGIFASTILAIFLVIC